MSRNTYRILNKSGVFLCYQVAPDASSAVEYARLYGFKNADRTVEVGSAA